MRTYVEDSARINLQGYAVQLCADSDGHLSIYVKHDDKSEVIDCTDTCRADEGEFEIRLTTEKIENDYIEGRCRLKPPTLDHVLVAGLVLLVFMQIVDWIIPT